MFMLPRVLTGLNNAKGANVIHALAKKGTSKSQCAVTAFPTTSPEMGEVIANSVQQHKDAVVRRSASIARMTQQNTYEAYQKRWPLRLRGKSSPRLSGVEGTGHSTVPERRHPPPQQRLGPLLLAAQLIRCRNALPSRMSVGAASTSRRS